MFGVHLMYANYGTILVLSKDYILNHSAVL